MNRLRLSWRSTDEAYLHENKALNSEDLCEARGSNNVITNTRIRIPSSVCEIVLQMERKNANGISPESPLMSSIAFPAIKFSAYDFINFLRKSSFFRFSPR